MAAILFSQHSSNPLEARTSDPRNIHYNRVYTAAHARAHPDDYSSSSDPLAAHPGGELQGYHEHLSQVVPGHPNIDRAQHLVDLDEDENMSDDELILAPNAEEEPQYVSDEEMEDDWEDGGPKEKDYFALDEEQEASSLSRKSEEEQTEIAQEIRDFERSLPQLEGEYRLLDRLGTGTFSSVYKALDLQYHQYDNSPWLGHHPETSSAHYQSVPRSPESRVFVAIKRIYVTSGPDRIRNELLIMEMCRGARHVAQVITAFRHEDQVAIVMPYHRNEDFRDYFETLPMEGIKAYFRCLLRAIRDIHARGIIHRDIKPANFLFDPGTGQGSLCDFGLAQTLEKAPTLGACLHTQPTVHHPHGQIQKKHQYDEKLVKEGQQDARKKSKMPSHLVGVREKDPRIPMKANRAGTRGFRAPEVLLKCGQQSGAVDVWSAGVILLFFLTRKFPIFQSNDDIEALMELASIFGRKRMESVATLHARKFATNVPDIPQDQISWDEFVQKLNPDILTPQPPTERFFPYTLPSYREKLRRQQEQQQETQQTTPTNVLIQLPDFEDELPPPSHIATSSSPLQFPISSPGNEVAKLPTPPSPAQPTLPSTLESIESNWEEDIRNTLDLVSKLLEPESVKRITPAAALAHPFLSSPELLGPYVPSHDDDDDDDEGMLPPTDDDAFIPHVFGEGVCGDHHFVDEVTEQPGVVVRRRKCICECGGACSRRRRKGEDDELLLEDDEEEYEDEYETVKQLVDAGEGIAIGQEPCEFHKDMVFS